ncbi:MAG: phosphate signaling complex protein PhoU [Lachnospiraceae bacterium]|nr:phosphate signaling complex protein PhoU [Lachnospiraceae bacterium]
MRNKFNEQLHILNNEMIQMGNQIVRAIQNSITAFFEQDEERARQIMQEDELVDQEQKKIEMLCFQLLAQQQPVAGDLRCITAAMKMVTDMERIGDHAADISELTILMARNPYPLESDNIRRMAAETMEMLLHAIEAYVERNIEKARDVISHDDVVDELFLNVKADLIGVMQLHQDYAEEAADLLLVNKYLERIGDHATNIAEWVIFAVDEQRLEKQ